MLLDARLTIRSLTPSDVELVCSHRRRMFEEAGYGALDEMAGTFRQWVQPRIESGAYGGFIVEDGEKPAAGIGLMDLDWPPHPLHPQSGVRGYILNLFVEPAYRRRGIARELMQRAEAAFAERGVAYVVLHASPQGRPLYESTGWKQTNEMAKCRLSAEPVTRC